MFSHNPLGNGSESLLWSSSNYLSCPIIFVDQIEPNLSPASPPNRLLFWSRYWCRALLWTDHVGGGDNIKKTKKQLCVKTCLIGSLRVGPWVKEPSDQSYSDNTSCHSSPTSCLRLGRIAEQCSNTMTQSDRPPHRGSYPRWQSRHLQDDVSQKTMPLLYRTVIFFV